MNIVYNSWLIDFELQQFRDLLYVLSTSLKDFEQKLEDWYTADDLENMDEEKQNQYERYIDIYQSVLGDFPRRIYSGFVVSWYSFVEDALCQLCTDLNITVSLRFQDQVGLGSGLQRAKRFLAETGQIDVEKEDWLELEHIRKIRNQIVHKGGKFPCSIEKPDNNVQTILYSEGETSYYITIDKELYGYLERNSLQRFYGTLFINPSLEYCQSLVSFGQRFFSWILSDLKLI